MSEPFQIAGFPWLNRDRVYRRLPLVTDEPLPTAVDSLANCTAGGQIRFQTDSRKLSIRVRLAAPADMNHMPATGQCGFDCYIGGFGRQYYYNSTRYDHTQTEYECVLFHMQEAVARQITLYFPLYQAVQNVQIGIEPEAGIHPPLPFRNGQRVIIYGTSVTQGGCASRPGMAYTNILSRRFPYEFINLGFSGSGKGEPEVARAIRQISSPACLVLDYEGNCKEFDLLQTTLPEFIRLYRERHPNIPILVLSRTRYSREWSDPAMSLNRLRRTEFQSEFVEQLRREGDRRIFFHDASGLLGTDYHECTVDGIHLTDLGFMRIADGLTPVLSKLLIPALSEEGTEVDSSY